MKPRFPLLTYLILVSLLSPVSAGAGGFVVSREEPSTTDVQYRIPKDPGQTRISNFVLLGGMYRWGDTYLVCDEGIGNLADFNYVEGLQLGPKFTLGHVTDGLSRWEVAPLVRYSLSSEAWQEELAVRYYAPVYSEFSLELSGGDVTTDFNAAPLLRGGQAAIAMSLFAWDYAKFYRKTYAQICVNGALGADWQLGASLAWQRRAPRCNSRWQSFFGRHVVDNWHDFSTTEVLKLNLQGAYTLGRRLVVVNDRTALSLSNYPTLTAGVELTTNVPQAHLGLSALRRRERWQLGVQQQRRWHDVRLSYYAEGGFFTGRRDALLCDVKHFEASRFGWQDRESLTGFVSLNDYQLSTDRSWLMLCASVEGRNVLLSRMMHSAWPLDVDERVAVRLLRVEAPVIGPDAPALRTEFNYAWSVQRLCTFGLTLSLQDGHYNGVGFCFVTILH